MRLVIRSTGRATAAIALVVALLMSVLVVSTDASPPPAPERASGKVKLKVVTPRGVPATATLRMKRQSVTVAKPPSGRVATRTFSVRTGRWKAAVRPLVFDDRYYVPTVTPARPTVVAGRTTVVTVRWKIVRTASELRATALAPTSLTLAFSRPARASVALRYTSGTAAPRSVKAGKAAPVSGSTAKVQGLTPGTAYSFGLFTKVDGRWAGPLPLTVSTRAPASGTGPRATYVADPATALVPPGTDLGARQVGAGVVTRLPSGVVPVIGTPVVLPGSTALPGGFVGTIVGVSADGSQVTLAHAALDVAFDYLKVTVPDLGSAAPTSRPVHGPMRASSGAPGCGATPGTGLSVSVVPTYNFDGSYLNFELASEDYFGVTVVKGLRVEAKLVANFSASISAAVSGSVFCSVPVLPVVIQFAAGPVPMLLTFEPAITVTAGGEGTISGGHVGVTVGFEGTIYKPVLGGVEFSTKPIATESVVVPSGSGDAVGTASLEVKAGGTVALGPGMGTSVGGVHAGISGSLNPIDAEVEATNEGAGWCVELSVGGSADVSLFAKAWVSEFSIEKSWTMAEGKVDYGGPWKEPVPCPTNDPVWVGTVTTEESYDDGSNSGSQATTYHVEADDGSTFSSAYEDAGEVLVPPCGVMYHAYSGTGSGDYPTLEFRTHPDGENGFLGTLFGVDDDHFHEGSGYDDFCVPNPDGPGYVTEREPYTGQVVVYPPGQLGCTVVFPVTKGTTHITGSVTETCTGAYTRTSTWTYDLQLQNCDLDVDSDEGGMPDCVEKAYGLSFTDPSDD